MTQCTHESRANVNHMRMLKNLLPCHATSNCNVNHKHEPKIQTQTLKTTLKRA